MSTHKVFNQSQPLVDYNMFTSDPVLVELMSRYGADWASERLVSFGAFNGSAQAQEWAVQADRNHPQLKTHDRFGHRVDQVEYHPSYHHIMKASVEAGVHNLPWVEQTRGAHVARAAMLMMAFQNEPGHCCPISMTYSVVPSLKRQPDVAKLWLPGVLSNQYDQRFLPPEQKRGLTMGMGMTEKQGGSDVRANTTRAVPVAERGPGKPYLLNGHKWFTSAPMSDAFLVLAQTDDKGISCFLVPRFKPDGTVNAFFIQRLKDKLGNRSNASSEPELVDTFGWLIGDEGRGVPTIIEMVTHTRLDCAISSTALMRQSTVQALNHSRYRKAFGKELINQPLMRNVLADLALESEAATRMTMRLASAYDGGDAAQAAYKRLASAITKYWVCKRVPNQVVEALECFGGNGYVEEGPMARLYREAPLLGIWEGSGNVICLDVLRAIGKEPAALDVVLGEIEKAKGHARALDRHINTVRRDCATAVKATKRASVLERKELNARRLVEGLALGLQASLMAQQAPNSVANAFIQSRLGNGGYAFGTLSHNADLTAILDRAYSG